MDMKNLFDDFMDYVESMSDDEIKESIQNAMKNTSDCSEFDTEDVEMTASMNSQSDTEKIPRLYHSDSFSYSSKGINCTPIIYTLSSKGGMVA